MEIKAVFLFDKLYCGFTLSYLIIGRVHSLDVSSIDAQLSTFAIMPKIAGFF
jgi:hypothetical protein